jgi:hypothetical protein
VVGLALWRGLAGWWLRLLAAAVVLVGADEPVVAPGGPGAALQHGARGGRRDASNRIDGRGPATADGARRRSRTRLARLGEAGALEHRVIRVPDRGDEGSRLMTALAEAAAELPPDRIAGAILLTDGQVHDADALEGFPAPVHVLL